MNKASLIGYETLIFQVHSYFEKGCGKSARDNPERYYGWFWTRSICQMQATFPWIEFLRILFKLKKRRKIRCRMSTSSIKREIRRFQVVVVQWTSKKCTKNSDAPAELLFWSLNLLFFEVIVVVVVVVLKFPNNLGYKMTCLVPCLLVN